MYPPHPKRDSLTKTPAMPGEGDGTPEIEITREMIEVGCRAAKSHLQEFTIADLSIRVLVEDVLAQVMRCLKYPNPL
jgi:hypothetical protein